MGLGDEPFGDEVPDVPNVPNDPTVRARPRAVLFDLVTRTHPLDENGKYIEVHPIDAAVVQQLGFLLGRIKGSPTTGWTIDRIDDFFGERGAANADVAARTALSRLIRRGDIAYNGMQYEKNANGPRASVLYTNLRLRPIPKKPTAVPLL